MDSKPQIELTKKERRELRRQQQLEERQKLIKQHTRQPIIKIARLMVIAVVGIGAFIWYLTSQPTIAEGEIISGNGLHWHSELAVFVKGEKQPIPANIGIGAVHDPIHTHDASGTMHLEFQGLVRADDVKLSHFFDIWGQDFAKFGQLVRMTVNNKENTDLQNYQMKNGDKIELWYE